MPGFGAFFDRHSTARSAVALALCLTLFGFLSELPVDAMKNKGESDRKMRLMSEAHLPQTGKPEASADDLPPVAPSIRRSNNGSSSGLPPSAPEIGPSSSSNGDSGLIDARDFETTSVKVRVPAKPQYANGQPQYGSGMPQSGRADFDDRRLTGSAQSERNLKTNDNGRSLTQVELKRLASHDMVLIIDRSASMMTHDCPGFGGKAGMISGMLGLPLGGSVSRWQWCTNQMAELSRQTETIFDRGITVVLFSSAYEVFQNVNFNRVGEIFRRNYPMGGTNLAPALGSQLGAYFSRRATQRGNVKPVVIGIVTDGMPNNKGAVKQAIIEATRMMRNPEEITIVFFLIGSMDYQGERFVNNLTNLARDGAAFPIVKGIPFSQLQQTGLVKAIAQNIQ